MMTKILCIYHGYCLDGFGAAWAVRRALGAGVEFHAGSYGKPPPDVKGRDVVVVDFSYKAPIIHDMAAAADTLVILDHHKSAAEDLAGLPPPIAGPYDPNAMLDWQRECNAPASLHALFDMERSGAGLAWDFFHRGKPRPRLIDYIEDRDLWRFRLPNSRSIHANLASFPYDFDLWDRLVEMVDDAPTGFQMFVAEGEAIERKHLKDVVELLGASKRRMVIGGHDVPVANLPYTMASDAGHEMAKGEPFAATYIDTPDGRTFSLRSTDDGLDVSAVARSYGGGGHAHAAGFKLPLGVEP